MRPNDNNNLEIVALRNYDKPTSLQDTKYAPWGNI